jgi:hypothetical protein
MPLPILETTPPVTKTNLVIVFRFSIRFVYFAELTHQLCHRDQITSE